MCAYCIVLTHVYRLVLAEMGQKEENNNRKDEGVLQYEENPAEDLNKCSAFTESQGANSIYLTYVLPI